MIQKRMTPDPRVDAYLAVLPADQREVLQALRERVAALAPEATELISYDMPAFKLRDRFLLSYAAWKRHCSIYAPGDDLLARYATELEGYGRTKGSLHFSKAQPLPDALVADFVRQRIASIEAGGR
jgi:uncharacterized protein YdhG (YjbR/CyaY superfamily)